MSQMGFREMLALRQTEVESLVCVGIDPLAGKMPECVAKIFGGLNADNLMYWMEKIVDATAP